MESRSLGEALQAIMKRHGWRQADLASRLGVTRAWVSHAIVGRRDPGIGSVKRRLDRVGWEVVIRPRQEGAEEVKRREFSANAVIATASITLLPSSKVGPYKNPEYLTALAARIGRLRYEQGGLPLLPEVARHIENIKELPASDDQRLLSAGSLLADKLSLALFDAGKTTPAENVGRFALSLGRKSKDVYRIGAAYESLVIQTRRTDAERASTYARKGVQVHDLPEDLKARLQARYAASLCGARDQGLSMSALHDAMDIVLESSEGQAVVDGTAGMVLYRLGQTEEGKRSLRKAIRAFSGSPLPHARWLAQKVRASLLVKDFGSASIELEELALLVPLLRSEQLANDLRDIFRLSAQWTDVPEIAQAREALRSVAPKNLDHH